VASIPRTVKGKKSVFFKDPAVDQLMTFIVELMAEVSVLRDRLDTVEELLERHTPIKREAIETFVHDAESERRRMKARQAMLQRVLRTDS
jgi:hypothetical protein